MREKGENSGVKREKGGGGGGGCVVVVDEKKVEVEEVMLLMVEIEMEVRRNEMKKRIWRRDVIVV